MAVIEKTVAPAPAVDQAVEKKTPLTQVADKKLMLQDILNELVKDKLVSPDAAAELMSRQVTRRVEIHPLVIIADQKWKHPTEPKRALHLDMLTEWLAAKVGLPYVHIDPFKIDFAAVTKVMSNAYATRFKILPIQVNQRECVIATCEPHVREWERELTQILRLEIKRVIASPVQINDYLIEFYNLARFIGGASKQADGVTDVTNFEQLVKLGESGKLDANDRHIVSIVDWIFLYAFQQRASDIHMEPRRDSGNVRFRIDGVLHQVYQIPTPVLAAMTSRIKILGRMDVVEKRRPQDGRIKTVSPDGVEVELRLSTMPTAFGEKLVMRIFNPDVLVRDFSELGFTDDDRSRWDKMIQQPHGIILVTGPTGSGKTTTLYSTLKQLATVDVIVCTVEDPIEMVEPAFNQMQVHSAIGLEFASGVRTLMRQDPDIIMVGEVRDLETAEMAIQAALTGHLVLSTLHTNDSPSAITRLLDLGVAPFLLHSTILGVMAQRLVRTLCPHCKEAGVIDDETWHMLISPWQAPKPEVIYYPKGCLECRMTGYMGRIGIYEIMLLTQAQRQIINAETDIHLVRQQAFKDGMKPLRISGAAKIAQGITSIDEVMKVAPPSITDRRVQNRS